LISVFIPLWLEKNFSILNLLGLVLCPNTCLSRIIVHEQFEKIVSVSLSRFVIFLKASVSLLSFFVAFFLHYRKWGIEAFYYRCAFHFFLQFHHCLFPIFGTCDVSCIYIYYCHDILVNCPFCLYIIFFFVLLKVSELKCISSSMTFKVYFA
jgi:hypothetical protein